MSNYTKNPFTTKFSPLPESHLKPVGELPRDVFVRIMELISDYEHVWDNPPAFVLIGPAHRRRLAASTNLAEQEAARSREALSKLVGVPCYWSASEMLIVGHGDGCIPKDGD